MGSNSSANQHSSLGPNLKWNAVVQASTSSSSSSPPCKKNSLSSTCAPLPEDTTEISPTPSAVHPKRRGFAKIIDESDPLSEILQVHSQSISADWKVVGNPVSTKIIEQAQPKSDLLLMHSISSISQDSPITQLPMSLNEEIGLDDPNEVAQIFERTSISAPPLPQQYAPPIYPTPIPTYSNNMRQSHYSPGLGRACSITGANYQNYIPDYNNSYPQRRTSFVEAEPEPYCEEGYFYDYPQGPNPYRHHHSIPRFPHPMHFRRHSANLHFNQHRLQHSGPDLAGECMLNGEMECFEDLRGYHEQIEYCAPQSAPPGISSAASSFSASPQSSQSLYSRMDPYQESQSSSLSDASFQLSSFKGSLYTVEFKASRTELFYILEFDGKPIIDVTIGDFVIVEADRGEDLGKITRKVSLERLKRLLLAIEDDKFKKPEQNIEPELFNLLNNSKEIVPKRIYRLASPHDLKFLQAKAQEEAIAMVRCQSRIRQKKLPMEMIDAEYQW
jgi:hypothetical protein